jgi:predicted TIM-barrel fold metal-dependent hydrolase
MENPRHPGRLSRRRFLEASLSGLAAATGCGVFRADGVEDVIDIHQHTNYGGKRDPQGKQTGPGRTDEQLMAHQRAMGVTRTILLPAGREAVRESTHQGQSNGLMGTCGGVESCLTLARAHPDLFWFGSNEVPDLPDAPQTLEMYLKGGAVVIGEQKFGVECDSPEMQRIYSLAEAYAVPVLMHWQFNRYNGGFERFYKMLEKFPKVRFIGHAQTWWANIDKDHRDQSVLYPKTKVVPGGMTDRFLSDYPNMFGDLSANSGQGALSRDEEHAREFLDRHQEKLMFGSDCADTVGRGIACIGAGTLALIRKLSPDRAVERKILYENALRVFRF